MKLTTRSEYALLALICLARHKPGEHVSGETIAQEQGIPIKFLQHILLALKHARYVQSTKGQHGGYRLAKPANAISIAEIVRLFDGALAPTESVSKYFYESTPIEREDGLIRVFTEIRDRVAEILEGTTIADVC
ncbi:MAG TPA: Rrf2 family transcriptional regulator [Candidatus Hydrogenedentes bacterium]|nr:Rrf2 family transcriptional regulator [Candidatus Hydrogenedentota bacterium]HOV76063.1 Rrf2 family transcriptional regulator [Candidatus Hydrogenedentota bacterium]HPC16948.1 Rrf2 family transcriptional regulator [Candidatus Hydrogenedentota bacterium]HRT21268.1 Rrf2 family transcriptional regulator [Candidatus Hydrogenedentota bacterium]HRT65130.1 Rrf2 family transcriptional regulator [Candidatus Hydrogenedentota bacterium]